MTTELASWWSHSTAGEFRSSSLLHARSQPATHKPARRINKCGVISPRYNIKHNEIEAWVGRLLPSRLVRACCCTLPSCSGRQGSASQPAACRTPVSAGTAISTAANDSTARSRQVARKTDTSSAVRGRGTCARSLLQLQHSQPQQEPLTARMPAAHCSAAQQSAICTGCGLLCCRAMRCQTPCCRGCCCCRMAMSCCAADCSGSN